MSSNTLERLTESNPLESLAPLGYRFLVESSHEPESSHTRKEIRDAYFGRASALRQTANVDYIRPAAVSISLPDDQVEFDDSLLKILMNRESVRQFSGQPANLAQIGFLLRLACGLKPFRQATLSDAEKLRAPRFYPSGGALYPLRVYLDAINIEGLSAGVYRYNPIRHSLDLVNDGKIDRKYFYNNNVPEDLLRRPSCVLILTGKPKIPVLKYREHAWKVLLMEAGHLAQNLILVSTGLSLASYPQSSLSIKMGLKALNTSLETEIVLNSIILGRPEKR